MKKILSIFLFVCVSTFQAGAQSFNYAWINSPAVGSEGVDTLLAAVVNDINGNNDLKFAVVSGSLTANGSDSQLDSVKILLDGLRIPYYVVPGEHELRWSESAGRKFNSLFKDGHFYFDYDSTTILGLNSAILWRGGGGHFSPEEIRWLSDTLKAAPGNGGIFIFPGYPFNEKLDNWFKAANLLTGYDFVLLFAGGTPPRTNKDAGGIKTVYAPPMRVKDNWNYTIVKNSADSVSVIAVKNGNAKIAEEFAKGMSQTRPLTPDRFKDFSRIVDKDIPTLKSGILWQADEGSTSIANLYTTADKIINTSFDGIITCYDISGKKLWSYDSGENIVSTPVSDGKLLIAATLQGDLISLDINTGKVIQIIGIGEPLTSGLATTDLVYNGSPTTGVIVATSGGKLFCYDIYSFELIWENDSAQGLVRATPLIFNHRIFFGSQDGFLYSVDARTGALYWKWTDGNEFYTAPSVGSPVTDGNYIYISTPDKNVYKIDILLGVTKWKQDYNAWESINITADKKYIIIKSISDKLYFARTSNGRRYKMLKMDYGYDLNPGQPVEWKGNFIFGSEKGKVYLIDKNYKWEPLFFAGYARLNLIRHVSGNIFAASNIDGKIICFEIK